MQKTLKGKSAEDNFKLTNKLKIVTTLKYVFNLWSHVISSAAHKEFVNLGKLLKFNKKTGWKSETKNLLHKVFKWLCNLSVEEFAKFAKHILNIWHKEARS